LAEDKNQGFSRVYSIGCSKMLIRKIGLIVLLVIICAEALADTDSSVRIKELCRLAGTKDNALVGYGLVTGLAGTGDSLRSAATLQSIKNILLRFGVNVPLNDVKSRNAAAVMVTANLPAYSQPGDKLDVNVTSMGDARSLVGGTLVLTHLNGPDDKIYALAQGPVSVGGFTYDMNGNVVQKNHPTAANIPSGAVVERGVESSMIDSEGYMQLVLYDPDFSTAERVAQSLQARFGDENAYAVDAARIKVYVPNSQRRRMVHFITQVESLSIVPDTHARVVVNERTGTVVSGGDVRISPTTITHGDLTVTIATDYDVSQPAFIRGINPNIRSIVVPDTNLDVLEEPPISVTMPRSTNIAELVTALNRVKASSRDVITILQGIKRAGALHAELIIQ
jgi:flagellar P-ring protein FlgI